MLYGQTGINALIWIHSTNFHSSQFTSSFVCLMIHELPKKKIKEKKNPWARNSRYQRKNLLHYNCSRQCLLICLEDWSPGAHCFILSCACLPGADSTYGLFICLRGERKTIASVIHQGRFLVMHNPTPKPLFSEIFESLRKEGIASKI